MKKNSWYNDKQGHSKAAIKGWMVRRGKSKSELKLTGELIRFTPKQKQYLPFLRQLVESGEPGRRIPTESGEWIAYGSTYPDWMQNQGWTKKEVLKVFDILQGGVPFPKKNNRQLAIADTIKHQVELWVRKEAHQPKIKQAELWASELRPGQKLKIKKIPFTVAKAGGEGATTLLEDGTDYHPIELAPFEKVGDAQLIRSNFGNTKWYYLNIIDEALKGVEYLQKAKLGKTPPIDRIVYSRLAREKLRPYFGVKKWPKRYEEATKMINKKLKSLA